MPEVHDLRCPEEGCGGFLILKESRYGPFYGCYNFPACKGTHGAHADGTPLGTPADSATKKARMEAHDVFDQMWKPMGAPYTRTAAYFEMQSMMSMTSDEAHIGLFSKEQCEALIRKITRRLERIRGG